MTRTLVKTQIRLQQFLTSREAGQGTLEYVGMVVIAALFCAGLYAAAQNAGLKDLFTNAINKITKGAEG